MIELPIYPAASVATALLDQNVCAASPYQHQPRTCTSSMQPESTGQSTPETHLRRRPAPCLDGVVRQAWADTEQAVDDRLAAEIRVLCGAGRAWATCSRQLLAKKEGAGSRAETRRGRDAQCRC